MMSLWYDTCNPMNKIVYCIPRQTHHAYGLPHYQCCVKHEVDNEHIVRSSINRGIYVEHPYVSDKLVCSDLNIPFCLNETFWEEVTQERANEYCKKIYDDVLRSKQSV